MDAHWVEILDRAHDHDVVVTVAHDFELVFLPSQHALLDEHPVHGGEIEAPTHDGLVFRAIVRNAAAGAAQTEGRANDRWESHTVEERLGLLPRSRRGSPWYREPDSTHRLRKERPVFGDTDRVRARADQLHAVAVQHATVGERHCDVERGLATHGRKKGVWPLALDHHLHELGRHWFDVRTVG